MTDQTKGLRFDVYERVHLSDEVADIDELEEIELVPRIQVVEQGEHAVLKGQLLLSGVYRSTNEAVPLQALEHFIPVEITMPLNRISRLDDVTVEIDNFDVDLLSSRTLNITGVLSLRGILVEPQQEPEEAWREEPFTVVHDRVDTNQASFEDEFQRGSGESFAADEAAEAAQTAQAALGAQAEPYFAGQEGQLPFRVEQEEAQEFIEAASEIDAYNAYDERVYEAAGESGEVAELEAGVTISSSPRDAGWSAAEWFQEQDQSQAQPSFNANFNSPPAFAQQPAVTGLGHGIAQERQQGASANQQEEDFGWSPGGQPLQEEESFVPAAAEQNSYDTSPWQENELERLSDWQEAEEASAEQQAEPEKQEMRIAFGSKAPEAAASPASGVGLVTLLQTSKREQLARQAAEQEAAEYALEQTKAQQPAGDEIEWRNLFLKQSDEREFRKIRVCIVQRDETLDSIAVRYNLNPREILLYNGLNESTVEEGQLLYIP
ncbi:stage VI sporulation protein D [Paenibacillus algorifonticola]|uniref:Stage VI sporulation protein D n=1 Tax=Paenibacillus algorifonticola TaxID=684063 RepID=A0A1I2B3L8_9BACL|nr:LysM peptidoglycan-binding domain-containing protein [Paenibacillus algorifonticola]SFE49760.1 stage VI sporulation protein D [Paenibacillus algorifonticola]